MGLWIPWVLSCLSGSLESLLGNLGKALICNLSIKLVGSSFSFWFCSSILVYGIYQQSHPVPVPRFHDIVWWSGPGWYKIMFGVSLLTLGYNDIMAALTSNSARHLRLAVDFHLKKPGTTLWARKLLMQRHSQFSEDFHNGTAALVVDIPQLQKERKNAFSFGFANRTFPTKSWHNWTSQ